MHINLPQPNNEYLSRLVAALRQVFIPVVSANEAVAQIILQSPNGTNYSVTVDNSGNLTTAVNAGKTRP